MVHLLSSPTPAAERRVVRRVLVGAAASLLALASLGARAEPSLSIQLANGIPYASGGIGSEEAQLIQRAATEWPASFEFAIRDGQRNDFAADVQVTVRNAAGQTVIRRVKAKGPFLLVDLQPGRYQVHATLAGRTLTQGIHVRAGESTHAVFLWPAGTDTGGGD